MMRRKTHTAGRENSSCKLNYTFSPASKKDAKYLNKGKLLQNIPREFVAEHKLISAKISSSQKKNKFSH